MRLVMQTTMELGDAKPGFLEHFADKMLPPGLPKELRENLKSGKQVGFSVHDPTWNVPSTTIFVVQNDLAAVEKPGGT